MDKKSFIAGALFVCAINAFNAPASAQTAPAAQIQSPCAINTSVQACAVVNKTIIPTAGPKDVTIDVNAARPLIGKVRSIAVIYSIRSRGFGSINANRGHEHMSSDVGNKPTLFWVTSNNGGKTWSKLTTTDMDSVLVGNW